MTARSDSPASNDDADLIREAEKLTRLRLDPDDTPGRTWMIGRFNEALDTITALLAREQQLREERNRWEAAHDREHGNADRMQARWHEAEEQVRQLREALEAAQRDPRGSLHADKAKIRRLLEALERYQKETDHASDCDCLYCLTIREALAAGRQESTENGTELT